MTEISQLNVAIAQANGAGADAQSLKDQQNEAVNKLAKLIDVSVMQRQDGGVDVTFGAGHPLVIGEVTYSLVSNPVGPLGLSQLMSNGINVTSEIKGGLHRRVAPGARHDGSAIPERSRPDRLHGHQPGEYAARCRLRSQRQRRRRLLHGTRQCVWRGSRDRGRSGGRCGSLAGRRSLDRFARRQPDRAGDFRAARRARDVRQHRHDERCVGPDHLPRGHRQRDRARAM